MNASKTVQCQISKIVICNASLTTIYQLQTRKFSSEPHNSQITQDCYEVKKANFVQRANRHNIINRD